MQTIVHRTPGGEGRPSRKPLLAAGVGAAGGLLGAWVMVRLSHLVGPTEPHRGHRQAYRAKASPNDTDGTISDEPGSMQAASAIGQALTGRPLGTRARRLGAPAVHYAFGITAGGVYGAAVELQPGVAAGWGLIYGAAVWLVADEIGLRLAGFSDSPRRYPLVRHAAALFTHLGFGLTVEGTRRLVLGRTYRPLPRA